MNVLKLALVVVLAACAYGANIIYIPTDLTSGQVYSFAQVIPSDNTRCSYYTLNVPAGTGSVQIDVVSPSNANSYLSVSAGFNYYPRADRDQGTNGNAFLFADNNINVGQSGRYHLCTYDPIVPSLNGNSRPSTSSTKDSTNCAAFVPNMHLGGKVHVCLSAWSQSATTAIVAGIQITVTAKPLNIHYGDLPATWTIAASTAGRPTMDSYALFLPKNVSQYVLSLSGSSADAVAYGLPSYSSSTRGYGTAGLNRWYHLHLINKGSAAATVNYQPTMTACPAETVQVTNNQASPYCATPMAGVVNTPTNITYNSSQSGSYKYSVYTFTVPTASATGNPFYYINFTAIAPAQTHLVYFSGYSWNDISGTNNMNPSWILGYSSAYAPFVNMPNGNTYWLGRYLVPGTEVQVTLTNSNVQSSQPMGQFIVSFSQETVGATQTGLVIGSTALAGSTETATVAGPAGGTSTYYLAAPLTTTGNNGYTITVDGGSTSILGVQIVSKDFKKIVASVGGFSSSPKFNFNVPSTFLPAADYYILAIPNTSGARTVTYTIEKTIATSGSAKVYTSLIVVVLAIVAYLF